ncbi:MAG: acyltransferase [Acidobacteria bacterium]|nr:acyltransferase [Acidobacteriota bacterium]
MATEPPPSYSPQLDGLRAVAVTAVVYSHWLPAWQFGVPLGAGVHLFFVLSGFLITRILLRLRDAPDRTGAVGRFYLRRVLRLFPAFYVVLAAAWVADVPLASTTWPWHAAYLSNAYIAWQGAWQGHFSHFWSLAVEEQFYLAWPWLVVWAPANWLLTVVVATMLLGPLTHALAHGRGLTEPFWALVPGGSADSLGVGALVAWTAWTPAARRASERIWPWAGVIGLLAWLALALVEWRGALLPPAVAIWRQALQGLIFAAVVWRAVDGWPGAVGAVLGHRAVVLVGRISYGIYLVHPFAPIVLDAGLTGMGLPASPALGAPGRALAAWLVTLALAAALWHLVEAPWHRLKAHF